MMIGEKMFTDRRELTSNVEKYAYTITDIEYPLQELQQLYSEIKDQEVDYSTIRDRATHGLFSSIKSDNYLTYPVIKKLVKMFNPITKKIGSGNIAIVVYKPGFVFRPHIDFSRKACIMFPIHPAGKDAPIDFYENKILEGLDIHGNDADHNENLYLGSHFYSLKHPTITNTEVPHGVRNDTDDIRVQLQFSIYDDYDQCVQRIKTGDFINH